MLKRQDRIHPETDQEDQEGEYTYNCSLSLTSALDEGRWSTPRPSRFTPENIPIHIVREAGWAPGLVWAGEENVAHIEIRSQGRPGRTDHAVTAPP